MRSLQRAAMELGMSLNITRLRSGAASMLASLLIVAAFAAAHAHAADVTVSKDLCGPSGVCVSQPNSSPSVPPLVNVTYPITLVNGGNTPLPVDLQENFQPGFHFVSMTCGTLTVTQTGSSPTYYGVTLPGGQTSCVLTGWYEYLNNSLNDASNTVTVFAQGDHATPLITSTVNGTVNGTAPLPTDVSVTKTATTTANDLTNGPITVHYTITIHNNGPYDVHGFILQDRLSVPATGVPLNVSYSNGTCTVLPSTSSCFDPTPSIANSPITVSTTSPTDFVQWSFTSGSPGLLEANGTMVIAYDVTVSRLQNLNCVRDSAGNSLINEAHISFNTPGATTTILDSDPSNNTDGAPLAVTINFPPNATCGDASLVVTKTQDPATPTPAGGFTWGSTVNYTIHIENTSGQSVGPIQLVKSDGTLGDLVQAGIGTPPFTAELVSATCVLPTACTNNQTPSGNVQSFTGYGDTHWMFGTVVNALDPHDSVDIKLTIRFKDPGCDAYAGVTLKPILNFARLSYQDPVLGPIVAQTPPVTITMAAPPACNFIVTKTADGNPGKIVFDTPIDYTVTYGNPNSTAATIGTLIDALRIVQSDYATQLPVDYSYTCDSSPAGGVTGYPGEGSSSPITGSVTAIFTSLPQQGVRIIQNSTPVIFQPNSTLTCHVQITVRRPSPGDPHCARVGALENAAVMDTSAFYNPNLPWPSGIDPGYGAKVSLPLPQCLNLVVNKFVNPIWTTQNGGPLNYTLTVTNSPGAPNTGDAIVAADGVTLTDNFTPNFAAASPWTSVCSPLSPACTFAWNPDPTSNPSALQISALAAGQGIVTTFPVTGPLPFPAPPGPICNHAQVSTSLPVEDWYAKNPATWKADVCVPIFDARPLDVLKTITIVAPATTPPTATFPVNVVCSYIQNGVQYGPSTTLTYVSPPTPGTQTVPNVPVGSTCTITEQQPLPPPVAMSSCLSGYGAWGPVTYPNPDGQSISIVTTNPNRMEVHNTFSCVPVGTLSVTKTFDPSSPASQFPATSTFPIQVACTGIPTTTVNVTGPTFQQSIPNIPVGSVCTITELTPTGTDVQANCHWDTTYPKGQSGTIVVGSINLEAHNKLSCTGTVTIYKTFDPTSLAAQMSVPAEFPVVLACPPIPSTTINLDSANQFQYQTPAMPVGTVCTITEQAPLNATVPANCQWKPVTYPKGQSITIPNGTGSLVVQNALTCDSIGTGTFTVTKEFDPPLLGSQQPPTAQFPVEVSCPPAVPTTTINLNSGDQFQYQTPPMPAGTVCSFHELTTLIPPPPPGCKWVTTYPKGQSVTIPVGSAGLQVRNALDCSTPQIDLGVTKVGPTAIGNGLYTFTVTVTNVGAPFTGTNVITLSDLMTGSGAILSGATTTSPDWTCGPPTSNNLNCTYTGSGPVATGQVLGTFTVTYFVYMPPHIMNCATVAIAAGSGFQDSNSQNNMACVDVGIDPSKAVLTFTKTTTNLSAIMMPNPPFPVTVDCQSNGPNAALSLIANTGYPQLVSNIPVGSNCTITETPPPMTPPTPAYCTWVTNLIWDGVSHPNGSQISNVQITQPVPKNIEVHNDFICNPVRFRSLIVTKSVTNQTSGTPPNAAFPINVVCTPGPTASLSLTAGSSATVTMIPVGATCTVTEGALPAPIIFPACAAFAGWVPPPNYIPSQSVLIQLTGGQQSVEVNNTFTCNPPMPDTGTLIVKKTVNVDGTWSSWQQYATTTFTVGVSCVPPTGSATYQNVSLNPANQYQQSVTGIAVGSQCSIAEAPPPNIFNTASNCHWVTTYPGGGQQVTIQAGSQTLEVHNEESCTSVPPNQAELTVAKNLTINGRIDNVHAMTFPVVVSCPSLNNGTPQTLPLTPNVVTYQQGGAAATYTASSSFGVTPGDTCTVNEPSLPPLSNNLSDCIWAPGTPSYVSVNDTGSSSSSSVILTTAQHSYQLVVNNALTCPPMLIGHPPGGGVRSCPAGMDSREGKCVRPIVCRPPMVANAVGNACVCPPGTVQRGRECVRPIDCRPPMVANPATNACVCPQGTVQRGRECVKPIDCRPPMVANPATNACVCPRGTVQRGRECVKPLACRPPMVANPATNTCVCPQGTVQRGRECVRAGRPEPGASRRGNPREDLRDNPRGGRGDPRENIRERIR
jgi:hypothetical protein